MKSSIILMFLISIVVVGLSTLVYSQAAGGGGGSSGSVPTASPPLPPTQIGWSIDQSTGNAFLTTPISRGYNFVGFSSVGGPTHPLSTINPIKDLTVFFPLDVVKQMFVTCIVGTSPNLQPQDCQDFMDNIINDVSGFLMSCRASCFDAASLVYGYINNNRTRAHGL